MGLSYPERQGNRWKPKSENRSGAVLLLEKDGGETVTLYRGNTVVAIGHKRGRYDDGRIIYDFSGTGSSYGDDLTVVTTDGHYVYIGDGAKERGNMSMPSVTLSRTTDGWNMDEVDRTITGATGIADNSESNVPGIKGLGNIASPELIDPALNTLTSITDTKLEFTDPVETLRRLASENRNQQLENYETAQDQTKEGLSTYVESLKDYLDSLSPYQQQLISQENEFNQQQKLNNAETAMPGIQDILNGEIKNAQTLANGKLLTSAEDLALEQTARSAGADAAWTRGLGDDSLVGQTLSNQLSVNQRQSLMQQGQSYLNSVTQLATNVLMDSPQKAMLGSEIKAPTYGEIQNTTNSLYNSLNAATTMNPAEAQSSIVGQRQFQSTMDYNTKVTNANLQEAHTVRAIEIAAQNAAAMNNFNQNVLNDQQQSASAKATSDAMARLEYLRNKGHINDEEYQRMKEYIDANGTYDFAGWARAKGWEEPFEDVYRRDTGQPTFSEPEKQDNVTPTNTSNASSNTDNTNTSSTTSTTDSTNTKSVEVTYKESQPNGTTSNSRILHSTSEYRSNDNEKLIVQTDGRVTIPEVNTNYISLGGMSNLDIANALTLDDLQGIL